jgi:hypothetical protein
MLHFVQHDRFPLDIILLCSMPKRLVASRQVLTQGKIDVLWFRLITDHNQSALTSV